MVKLNIETMLRLTKIFLPPMIAHGRGRILNLAAERGENAGGLLNVQLATKAFVRSYGEGLAEELKETGVTVTTLCAGTTDDETAAEAGYRGLMAGERRVTVDGEKPTRPPGFGFWRSPSES